MNVLRLHLLFLVSEFSNTKCTPVWSFVYAHQFSILNDPQMVLLGVKKCNFFLRF